MSETLDQKLNRQRRVVELLDRFVASRGEPTPVILYVRQPEKSYERMFGGLNVVHRGEKLTAFEGQFDPVLDALHFDGRGHDGVIIDQVSKGKAYNGPHGSTGIDYEGWLDLVIDIDGGPVMEARPIPFSSIVDWKPIPVSEIVQWELSSNLRKKKVYSKGQVYDRKNNTVSTYPISK